jgi:hypothetical protein
MFRCGWDCEFDGYDDDSQPLPKFRAKYEEFIALIKAGKTAHWEEVKEVPHRTVRKEGKKSGKSTQAL